MATTTLPPHGEPIRPLTRRQEEVLDELAFGHTYAAIAEKLGIDEPTVRDHVNRIAMLLPNDGDLPPEKLVRAWAGWRFWRRHFARHPAIAAPGPPIT